MDIEDYIEAHISPEPDRLYQLYRETNLTRLYPRMCSGHVQGRLLKDDASAAQWLDYFTLAQITEFINLVTEKGDCPNSAAALLEYKNAKYPDADPFAEFVLDL